MEAYCPITGEVYCKCFKPQMGIHSFKVDIKATFRKLFTDHAVYTKFVLNGIIDKSDSVSVFLDRLLMNQVEIGQQLKPIIGEELGNAVSIILQEHIKSVGEVIKSIAAREQKKILDNKIKLLLDNSHKVAELLSYLNPVALPLNTVDAMFKQHNVFVKDIAIARVNKDYITEQRLYDSYYNQMLEMSDAIVAAL